VLEGVIDAELLYHRTPARLFLAVSVYGNDSAGVLTAQVPVGNGDGNVDAEELLQYGIAPPADGEFKQQGDKLVGSGFVGSAYQGWSTSLSADGNTLIIGGQSDSGNYGSAWVFTRTNGVWVQQGTKLRGSGAIGKPNFGCSVALSADGNTAIVGGFTDNNSKGAAWVFIRNGQTWSQQGGKLVGTGGVVSNSGISVAISGDGNTALVGGWGTSWMFSRAANAWFQQGPALTGTGAIGNSAQGVAVGLAADGNTAMIGGYDDDGSRGAVWMFIKDAGVWHQQGEKLVADGSFSGQRQGGSVALSGDGNTAIVGQSNVGPGGAWIWTRLDSVWSQTVGMLVGIDAVDYAQQGGSVSISGDGKTAVLGGTRDNNYIGATWIFKRNGNDWIQEGTKLVGTGVGTMGFSTQGQSVAISSDGSTIASGSARDSNGIGATWVFSRAPKPPVQIVNLTGTLLAENKIKFDWTTLYESDNHGFQLQRSRVDSIVYTTIEGSFVQGSGTTTDPHSYSYIDSSSGSGQWLFRVRQIGLDWTTSVTEPVRIDVVMGVAEHVTPGSFRLAQNYPNPFNPSTTLSFDIPQTSFVVLKIFDVLGREVTTAVSGVLKPGSHSARFDGSRYASGVYFYRLEARRPGTSDLLFSKSAKMLLVK
jgi:hypothetical protein